jgi:hypothetical protein
MFDLPLHHIGVASRNIEQEERIFSSLGYAPCSEVFVDQDQGIRGIFVAAPNRPALELLENLDNRAEKGTLSSFLKRGIKLYHFAYASCSIEADTERLRRESQAKIIVPVMGAALFEKISFAVLPNQLIVELVQVNKTLHDDTP